MPPPTLRMVSSGTASAEENDWRIGKQLSAVVQDELQARIGHRDDQVDPAAVVLPLDVVLESQQRLFVGEEIGLQVLGEIVNGHVGACQQPLADCGVQNGIGREVLGARVDRQHGSRRGGLCLG